MKGLLISLLLITVFGCKKNSDKPIPVANLNPYLALPYKGNETMVSATHLMIRWFSITMFSIMLLNSI